MNADQYFDHWQVVFRDLMRAVAMLKDDDLNFRPTEAYPRTVGDILRHMIRLEQGWIQVVILRQLKAWPDTQAGELTTVDAIRTALESTHQETFGYLATVPAEDFNRIIQIPGDGNPKLGWILWHVFEQQIHHRGELFLCLSLMGYDRPKTDRPQ
jgi:uncharacterized damage-inducible protein DinB